MCCGGILGLGEDVSDRAGLLQQLATMPVHPESVPINRLVAIKGTPLQGNKSVEPVEMIRFVYHSPVPAFTHSPQISVALLRFLLCNAWLSTAVTL